MQKSGGKTDIIQITKSIISIICFFFLFLANVTPFITKNYIEDKKTNKK